jgi:uncharacterized NAD(P)/FAD-binding protein YdhS
LVRKLDALGPAPALVELARALRAAQLSLWDVADYVHINPRSYNRAPVVLRDHYELLVMTWLPGQASVPHDHTGSICAMQVLKGEAIEGCYRIAADGYVDLEYETAVPCGEVIAGHDAGVHTLANPSQSGKVLVTVHVYAPPLKDFRQFVPRLEQSDADPAVRCDQTPTIVVVGGGFSGSMSAAQLLRRAGRARRKLRVVVVERAGAIGAGLAYGTREGCHLLNVPAGRMSAWPDSPDDFVGWASRRHGKVRPEDFLPRPWYGQYVRDALVSAAQEARDCAELSVVLDEVRCVARHPAGGWMVHCARGPSLRAVAVVLAVGHRPPTDPIGPQWSGPRTRFIANPWRPLAMNAVRPDEAVVILGSGLTAVDAVLALAQQKRQAPITLVSRHGLLPQAHAAAPLTPVDLHAFRSRQLAAAGGLRARTLVRELRRTVRELASEGVDWRSVLDGLRPHTPALWQAMPPAERRRFLARLRPFWEVHRHRMALTVAERVHTMLAGGELSVLAGSVASARADGDGVRLVVRERGSDRLIDVRAAWVVNCTGPAASNSAESNPVIGSLLVHGWLCPDELALGIETSSDGAAMAADGRAVPDLFIVGTLRKPAFWESTAVPELRNQAETVAACVLDLLTQEGRSRSVRLAG